MTPSKPGRALTDADLEALDNGVGTVAIEQLAAVEVRALRFRVAELEGLLRRVEPDLAGGHDGAARLRRLAGILPSPGETLVEEIRAALARAEGREP